MTESTQHRAECVHSSIFIGNGILLMIYVYDLLEMFSLFKHWCLTGHCTHSCPGKYNVAEVYASLQNALQRRHMENIQSIAYAEIITQALYVFYNTKREAFLQHVLY